MNLNFVEAMNYAKEQGGATQSKIYADILRFFQEQINTLCDENDDPLSKIYFTIYLNDDNTLFVSARDGVNIELDKGYFLRGRDVKTQAQMKTILRKLEGYYNSLLEEPAPKVSLADCQIIPCVPQQI